MSFSKTFFCEVLAQAFQGKRYKDHSSWFSHWILLFAIVVLGAGLRFYKLGSRSLWLDEVITAQYQGADTLTEVLRESNKYWDTRPLPAVLTWTSQGLGQDEAALRTPFAVAGVLTILAIYRLGATLFRPRAGLFAACLYAILPFSVWYGQEARPYTLVMLLSTLQMLLAYQVMVIGRRRAWFGLALISIVSLYTHYLMLVPTAAAAGIIGFHLLTAYRRRELSPGSSEALRVWTRQRRAALASCGGILLAYAPWLGHLIFFIAGGQGGTGRLSTPSTSTLSGMGDLLAAYDLTGFLLFGFLLGLLTLPLLPQIRRGSAALLLLLWFVIPIAVLILTLRSAMLGFTPWARYLSFLYPAAILLCTLGVESFATLIGQALQGGWRFIQVHARHVTVEAKPGPWVVQCVLLLCILLISWQIAPQLSRAYVQPKDDYRAATRQIAATSPPDSVILLTVDCPDWMVGIGLQYYVDEQGASLTVLPAEQSPTALTAALEQHSGHVWGAVSTYPLCGGQQQIKAIEATATPLEIQVFSGLLLYRPRDRQISTLEQARLVLVKDSALPPRSHPGLELLP